MATFYFTYGWDHHYRGGWTEVTADDQEKAIAAFNAYHPLKDGFIACCSIYGEAEFKKTSMYLNGNLGYRCHEQIGLGRFITERSTQS